MVNDDASARPSASNALARFRELVDAQTKSAKFWRLRSKDERKSTRLDVRFLAGEGAAVISSVLLFPFRFSGKALRGLTNLVRPRKQAIQLP